MARMLNGRCGAVSGKPDSMRPSPVEASSTLRSSLRLAFVVLLPLVLIGCEEKKPAAVADIDAGKVLAQAQCAGCHGLDGRGAAPGIPDLAAQDMRYLLASLSAYKQGERTHAALQDLTSGMKDADVVNVAGYYASLPPLKESAETATQTVLSPLEKGEAAAKACASCHGEAGNSTTPGIPNLAGQQPRYFISAVQAYLEGKRSIEGKEMLRQLSHVDMESLALYYASQTPARRAAPDFGNAVAGEPASARCGGCHGAQGVSHDASTPSLASQDPDYLVKAIKAYRDQTRQHSVMLDTNTDEEINNLAAFYAVQQSKAAEGSAITMTQLVEKCDRCHGAGVEQPTLIVPKISGQERAYLINALRAYRDGKRGSSMMHNMSLPYSETLIESVASFYASQPAR